MPDPTAQGWGRGDDLTFPFSLNVLDASQVNCLLVLVPLRFESAGCGVPLHSLYCNLFFPFRRIFWFLAFTHADIHSFLIRFRTKASMILDSCSANIHSHSLAF